MTHLLPTTPITTEAEAQKAARASAISIFIGVAVGIVSAIWTLMHPEILANAVASAEASTPGSGAGAQMGVWLGYAMIVIQAVFGLVQWRSPAKWIAILFIVLIVLGFLLTAVAPVLSGMVPNAPVTPMWQIVLSLAILIVQFVLHLTGLKGIGKLEKLQLEAANSAY